MHSLYLLTVRRLIEIYFVLTIFYHHHEHRATESSQAKPTQGLKSVNHLAHVFLTKDKRCLEIKIHERSSYIIAEIKRHLKTLLYTNKLCRFAALCTPEIVNYRIDYAGEIFRYKYIPILQPTSSSSESAVPFIKCTRRLSAATILPFYLFLFMHFV